MRGVATPLPTINHPRGTAVVLPKRPRGPIPRGIHGRSGMLSLSHTRSRARTRTVHKTRRGRHLVALSLDLPPPPHMHTSPDDYNVT